MLNELQTKLAPYTGILGDNPWMQALVVIVLSLLIAWILNHYVVTTLRKLLSRTGLTFDKQVLTMLNGPVYTTVLLVGLALATNLLAFGETYERIVFSILQSIALIVWTLFAIRLIQLLLRHFANSTRFGLIHPQTLPLFNNLVMIVIAVIAIYAIFSAWGVDMTAWLASAGIVGIAVGFAAKDTLANLFSGVFILADAPYKVGDYVVLDTGERGEVTHIGIRSTRLLTRDDVEVTVPNSIMGNTKIINESGGPHQKYRIRVKVGVAYGSDIDRVEELLMEAGANNDKVCDDPAHRVRFRQFGGSSLDFELLCWVDQPAARGFVTHQLLCAIYKRFNEEGIEIPFSQHDLYIKELPERGSRE